MNELAINNKIKNLRDLYRGVNAFNEGYQPSHNLVKDDNGDLIADSHNIYGILIMSLISDRQKYIS
jgi:hypothetical protein